MPVLLFVAFIVVPLIELAVISQVGALIGFWPTLLLLLADSVIGAVLVRQEGRRAWQSFRQALDQARWPGDEVVQGALVLVGGALLLTPGFVTDVVGLGAVAPPTRRLVSKLIRRQMTERTFGSASRSEPARDQRSPLDVEVMSIEPDEPPDDGPGDRER